MEGWVGGGAGLCEGRQALLQALLRGVAFGVFVPGTSMGSTVWQLRSSSCVTFVEGPVGRLRLRVAQRLPDRVRRGWKVWLFLEEVGCGPVFLEDPCPRFCRTAASRSQGTVFDEAVWFKVIGHGS